MPQSSNEPVHGPAEGTVTVFEKLKQGEKTDVLQQLSKTYGKGTSKNKHCAEKDFRRVGDRALCFSRA